MQKEFVNYEIAVALKELGFDEECFNRFYTKRQSKMFGVDEKGRHYPIKNTSKKLYTMGEYFVLNDSNVILAPTFSQAFRWFREKYGLISYVHPFALLEDTKKWCYEITNFESSWDEDSDLHTLEEAELACLVKLIGIIKK